MARYASTFAIVFAAATSAACSSSSSTGAKAQVSLRNDTGASSVTTLHAGGLHFDDLPSQASPVSDVSHFAMKLASIYLVEDVDPTTQNNVGQGANLWVSPHCTSADDCDFFEFARPTAELNADLNSQALDVMPGTYRYMRLEFCYHGEAPTQPNVSWTGPGMTSPQGFIGGGCGITSKEFAPPLVLEPGDTVSVSLGYDLTNSVSTGAVTDSPGQNALTAPDGHGIGFNDCAIDDAMTAKDCFNVPVFTPSVSKDVAGPSAAVVESAPDAGAP